jgi:redox-sensitive bicupin YhaK (pirin superfamily)
MEIVSIPLSGALKHQDTTGKSEIIKTGDVQIMSAGSGLQHSEVNASNTEDVKFLQIWVFPKEKNITPRYEQKTFNATERINNWQTVVSPEKDSGGVWINQDAWFSLANIEEGKELDYTSKLKTNGVYLLVLEGELEVEGETLKKRDAIGITEAEAIKVKALKGAEVLMIEVPMNY